MYGSAEKDKITFSIHAIKSKQLKWQSNYNLALTLQSTDAGDAPQRLTLNIGPFFWMFSDSQWGSLLLLSSCQQVSNTLVVDLQEAAGTLKYGNIWLLRPTLGITTAQGDSAATVALRCWSGFVNCLSAFSDNTENKGHCRVTIDPVYN